MIQGINSQLGYSINCSESETQRSDEQVIPRTGVFLPASSEMAIVPKVSPLSIQVHLLAYQKKSPVHDRKTTLASSEVILKTEPPDSLKPWQKKRDDSPPPLGLIPDDRYTFSDESIMFRKAIPSGNNTDHSGFHDVEILKKGGDHKKLKQRLYSVLSRPNYCRGLESSEPAVELSEACKRAMRWQAQALAFSTDKPGYIIFNRLDKIRSHFISRPDIIAEFVNNPTLADKLNTQGSNRPGLSEDELFCLNESVIKLCENIYLDVLDNIKTIETDIANIASDIHLPTHHYNFSAWCSRYDTCAFAINSDLGRLRCGEAATCSLETKLQRDTIPVFIPIACSLKFLEFELVNPQTSEVTDLKDHTFLILMESRQYQRALAHNMFISLIYNSPQPIHVPFASHKKVGNKTAESEEKIGIEGNNNTLKRTSELPLPNIFDDNYMVIADPWLQESRELNSFNWESFLKSNARRWNYKSFTKYQISFFAFF